MNHPHGKRPQGHQHPPSDPAKGSGNAGLFWVVGGLFLLIVAIGKCSTPSSTVESATSEATNVAQAAIGSAIATQAPPLVLRLDVTNVKRGEANLAKANVEGLPGEMIYSQNCYDALGRHFSWAKLDSCGAFDMAAVRDLGDSEAPGFDTEAAWFESEAAAGRYLKAAIAAGEDPDAADMRLSDLQAKIAKARPADLSLPGVMGNEGDESGGDTNASEQRSGAVDTLSG